MPKHFEVTTPRPLGHRQTVNAADKAEVDQAIDLLAERLAPLVAELLEGKAPATNGSNGRKIADAYQPPAGDHWDDVDLNDAIDSRNDRKPGALDEYGFPDELRGDLDAYQLPD